MRADVKVVPAPVQGAAAARNAALEVARGAIYAFIDSDCRPAPNWLEEGLKALESTDVVGGRVDVDFADPARPNAVEAFEAVFAFDFKRYIEKEGFTGTGNMFVRRATFERVGLFRNGLSEDKDWSRRAMAIGLKITYCGNVVVSHPARRSWEELARKTRRVVRETVELKRAEKTGAARLGDLSLQNPGFSLHSRFQGHLFKKNSRRGAETRHDRRAVQAALEPRRLVCASSFVEGGATKIEF